MTAKRDNSSSLAAVTAVVLTHRRPHLAGDVVRSLLDKEGFPPERIIVVVNGAGGLDEAELEHSVRMVRLSTNTGPAGGFRVALLRAFEEPGTEWAYLCEDDIGLFNLPAPRVAGLLRLVGERPSTEPRVGAVVSYGRRFTARGHTVNVVPGSLDPSLVPVDVAAWGASLVNRAVVDLGILPCAEWFFGYEDFDFFSRVRSVGFQVLVDAHSARLAAQVQTSEGRDQAIGHARPTDGEEPWRAYYVARNFVHLARRHGKPTWLAWHLAYSARRMQRASNRTERLATLRGLTDGIRGRLGANPNYLRLLGERADEEPSDTPRLSR